jgi:hypothetical protein
VSSSTNIELPEAGPTERRDLAGRGTCERFLARALQRA